jgi:glycosyltransferase involved in cell wall biosynthesis
LNIRQIIQTNQTEFTENPMVSSIDDSFILKHICKSNKRRENMIKVWLINSAEATPLDEGNIRLRRTPLLARALLERKHEVLWWNADFFHATKKHRFGKDKTVEIEPHYTIRFLHGPGYKKHVSFSRFWDHRIIAQKFLQESENIEKPDIILCSLPTLDLANAATKYGQKYHVPVVLDIRDLWPDIMIESVPTLIRPIAKLGLISYEQMAIKACRAATIFTGNTPKFVEWGLKKAKRSHHTLDYDFPFGYEEPIMSAQENEDTDQFWLSHGISRNINAHIVTYIGTIGQNFQDDIIIKAIQSISQHHNVKFVFCGGGDRLEELRCKYRDNQKIVLPGWINAKQIWRLMYHTHIALASYKESENYRSSLTNKTIEYMAGGLPILFSIDDGYVADLIRDNEIGLTYGGSSERLAEAINLLLDNKSYRNKLAQNARNLYLEKYQCKTVYKNMAEYLEKIVTFQRPILYNIRPIVETQCIASLQQR